MTLYRVFPFDRGVRPDRRGGALYWPRRLQGAGRHDNPDLYACMYVAEEPATAVAETLAPFRGAGGLVSEMLERNGLPLAVAALGLPGDRELVDLDEPAVLSREALRPSTVATRARSITQDYARRLFERRRDALGLRWWSTLESLWTNATLFDRAAGQLQVEDVRELSLDDEPVREAAALLGLRFA